PVDAQLRPGSDRGPRSRRGAPGGPVPRTAGAVLLRLAARGGWPVPATGYQTDRGPRRALDSFLSRRFVLVQRRQEDEEQHQRDEEVGHRDDPDLEGVQALDVLRAGATGRID